MSRSTPVKCITAKKQRALKKQGPVFLAVPHSLFMPQHPEWLIKFPYPPDPILPRSIIYTTDVINIMGLKPAAASKLMTRIRKADGFPGLHYITVKQFCDHTGIPEKLVYRYLLWTMQLKDKEEDDLDFEDEDDEE